jgi:hypothetical protein
VVEENVKKEIDSLPSSRLPDLLELPDETTVTNATLEETDKILLFKHAAHAVERDLSQDVERIGIVGFFATLESNLHKGTIGACWKPECEEKLHPDEVDEVLRLVESLYKDLIESVDEGLAESLRKELERYRTLVKRYRVNYTSKFGKEVKGARGGATGGGSVLAHAAPAGGAGVGRRTRRYGTKKMNLLIHN